MAGGERGSRSNDDGDDLQKELGILGINPEDGFDKLAKDSGMPLPGDEGYDKKVES